MLSLFVFVQLASIVLLFFTTIYLFTTWKQKTYSNLFLYSLATLINNIGYLIEMTATTSGETLIGTKFAYLGKVFIPFSLLCFTVQYLNVGMKKVVQYVLAFIHSAIFFMVFTCEHHTLFYTDITYTTDGLFPHNVYGHGIIYNIYTALLIGYILLVLGIVIFLRIKSKSKEEKARTVLVLACAIISMTGFVVFLTGMSGGYDTTSFAYMLCTLVMIVAVIKYDLLEVMEAVNEYVTDNLYAGLLAISNDGQVVYRNETAEKVCDNLDCKNMPVVDFIREKIAANEIIEKSEKIYKPRIADLVRSNKKIGMLYILDNITEEYQHAKEIECMALTDAMTELMNRRAYELKLDELHKNGIPDGTVYICFDVNGLKKANDSLGHESGDELIKGAACCIMKAFGNYGSVYRIGGDEFVAIVTISDEKFEELLLQFDENVKAWKGTKVKKLSISLGAVSKMECPNNDILDLAKMADSRMYEAKSKYYQVR